MNYNKYFPGNQIAMPQPLHDDQVTYADGTKATIAQEAHDVTTFLYYIANPHMELTLEVADAKGKHDVSFAGHSANNIYRLGWRKDMVKEGDTLTIVIAPRRDGSEGGYVKSVTTADGHKF